MNTLRRQIYETVRTCEYNEELFRRRARKSRRREGIAQLFVTLATSGSALSIVGDMISRISGDLPADQPVWIWKVAIVAGAIAAAYLSAARPGHAAATAESLAARWTMLRGDCSQLELEMQLEKVEAEEARTRLLRLRAHFAALDQEDIQPQNMKEGLAIMNLVEARQGLEPRE